MEKETIAPYVETFFVVGAELAPKRISRKVSSEGTSMPVVSERMKPHDASLLMSCHSSSSNMAVAFRITHGRSGKVHQKQEPAVAYLQ